VLEVRRDGEPVTPIVLVRPEGAAPTGSIKISPRVCMRNFGALGAAPTVAIERYALDRTRQAAGIVLFQRTEP
jgi:hypothetical protein